MSRFRLYAVEEQGPRLLPTHPDAAQFADLYRDLSLGVYDALRTFEHNKFLYLERHLARTEKSMSLLGWDYHLDWPRLLRALHDVVTACPWAEMRVRIDVLAEPATPLGSTSRELIALQPFTPPPPELYEIGVAVEYAPGLARHEPLAKTANFAAARPSTSGLAQLEKGNRYSPGAGESQQAGEPQARAEPYEYLLLSPTGQILEGTGTNFWAVRDGTLYTAGEGVLEGITREIVLHLVRQLGIPLRLEAIRRDEVATIQEAALSGSSRAFLPVVKISGETIGNGRPGPVSRRILSAYNEFVAENTRTALELLDT